MTGTARHRGAVVAAALTVGAAGVGWSLASTLQKTAAVLTGVVIWWIWATCPPDVSLLRHAQAQVARVTGPLAALALAAIGLWLWIEPRAAQQLGEWKRHGTAAVTDAVIPGASTTDIDRVIERVRERIERAKGGAGR
jgi:hypothetical protein